MLNDNAPSTADHSQYAGMLHYTLQLELVELGYIQEGLRLLCGKLPPGEAQTVRAMHDAISQEVQRQKDALYPKPAVAPADSCPPCQPETNVSTVS